MAEADDKKQEILDALRKEGITSLDDLADRALQAAREDVRAKTTEPVKIDAGIAVRVVAD